MNLKTYPKYIDPKPTLNRSQAKPKQTVNKP